MGYDWPGNVRELENVIERAVVLATQNTIEVSHLPDRLLEAHIDSGPVFRELSYKQAKQKIVNSFSKEFVERLLLMSKGNVSQAAKQAKMDAANFRRLMRKNAHVRNDPLATAIIIEAYKDLLKQHRSFLTYLYCPAHI
jgi:transcriptional regulator with PAS, ATPase and Fis domain